MWRPLKSLLQPRDRGDYPPIRTAESVDIERFMGYWCVVANIPTAMERDAFNATESYELNDDGTVTTRCSFNKGAYDGPRKTYTSKGHIDADSQGSVWEMQLFGLVRADFRVVYVSDDYSYAIIGREKRDYVWILSRYPEPPAEDYFDLVRRVREEGYDTNRLRAVPQRWSSEWCCAA